MSKLNRLISLKTWSLIMIVGGVVALHLYKWKAFRTVCTDFNKIVDDLGYKKTRCNHLVTLMNLFPDKDWNWCELSRNPSITFDIMLNNLDKPWDWRYLSMNPNITFDIVLDNLDKPWSWLGLSANRFGL